MQFARQSLALGVTTIAAGGILAILVLHADAAGGARVGSHRVRDGGDACADCRDAAVGRAALTGAESGQRLTTGFLLRGLTPFFLSFIGPLRKGQSTGE